MNLRQSLVAVCVLWSVSHTHLNMKLRKLNTAAAPVTLKLQRVIHNVETW